MALVTVSNVSKKFCRDLRRTLRYGLRDMIGEFVPLSRPDPSALRRDEFWALRDVSFDLQPGDALALLGPNGAGKSTMLKMLTGIFRPDTGEIRIRGRVASLIELGTGFNPVLTGRENIYVNAALLGFDHAYVDRRVDSIIDFADIGDFVDAPVMSYSSGMYVRLAYAVAANLEPDVLLVDEVLAVGDAAFRRKCIRHMKRYVENGGSLIVVSHTPPLLEIVCNRSLVLHDGQVDYAGSISEGIDQYFGLLGTNAGEAGLGMSVVPPASIPATGRDRPATTLPATPRAGKPTESDPIRIHGIRIEPENAPELATHAPAMITLTYEALVPYDRVLWGLVFYLESEGLDVCSEVCVVDRLPAGKGRLRARIPRLPFVSGTFALRSALVDEATQMPLDWIGWQEKPIRFSVPGDTGLLNTFRKYGGAIVSVEVEMIGASVEAGA